VDRSCNKEDLLLSCTRKKFMYPEGGIGNKRWVFGVEGRAVVKVPPKQKWPESIQIKRETFESQSSRVIRKIWGKRPQRKACKFNRIPEEKLRPEMCKKLKRALSGVKMNRQISNKDKGPTEDIRWLRSKGRGGSEETGRRRGVKRGETARCSKNQGKDQVDLKELTVNGLNNLRNQSDRAHHENRKKTKPDGKDGGCT